MITEELLEQHNLTKEEYEKIKEFLGREPNLVELGIFSVMWSEHCSYKSSKAYLKNFPTEGKQVIQGPGENAGVVDIGDNLAAVFKMESHNHPSYIEPYQGAATGVGGILRDVFTMGARPVANMNSLRFGELDNDKMKYLFTGVVEGIAGYGNCMGIPTVGGEIYFDDCYKGNILVNAFTLGIAEKDRIFYGKAEGVGNPVIYVGSKTGRDGIHGATMASEEFDDKSEEKRPTVQVGDPFTEKLLLEACMELFETDCLVGIQDMGAAGLTSSSFEMASRAGSGIDLYLSKVPLREEGMTPYEIMLSESQERMLLVAKKGMEDKVFEIFEKWGLDCAVVGKVTDTGYVRIFDLEDNLCAELPVHAVVDKCPVYKRPYEKPEYLEKLHSFDLNTVPLSDNLGDDLKKLLASHTIASKEWVYTIYDHQVQTNTVFKPGSAAALIRIKGTSKGIAISTDCNSRYVYLDPERGGMIAVCESARNVACTGAKPLAVTDCLNFGNPEKPEIMYQFVKAIEGMSKACKALNTPVVSGNVSFYNETKNVGIFPTPTIGMVGLIENIENRIISLFPREGLKLGLIGKLTGEVGGSEFLKIKTGEIKGKCPDINPEDTLNLIKLLEKAGREGLFKAANDVSEGGIAVLLCEMAFGKSVGFTVYLKSRGIRPDFLLFGESQNVIVVAFEEKDREKIERLCSDNKLSFEVIGETGGDEAKIFLDGKKIVAEKIDTLKKIWQESIENALNS